MEHTLTPIDWLAQRMQDLGRLAPGDDPETLCAAVVMLLRERLGYEEVPHGD